MLKSHVKSFFAVAVGVCGILGGIYAIVQYHWPASPSRKQYPFIGQWELVSQSGPMANMCSDYMKTITVTQNSVKTPFVFSLIDEVREENGRYIVSSHDGRKPGPPTIFKDVTSSTMSVETVLGEMVCKMKKVKT